MDVTKYDSVTWLSPESAWKGQHRSMETKWCDSREVICNRFQQISSSVLLYAFGKVI